MNLRRNEPLTQCNTLALPARAQYYCAADTPEAVEHALAWARAEGMAVTVLGAGSNVVLRSDVAGLVLALQTRGITELERSAGAVRLRVAGGENWHQLVSTCVAQGYQGLENLALIPGTVGAAPIQNIGAYGVELAQFVTAVHVLDIATGQSRVLSPEACAFGYRDSVFKRELRDCCIVTAVDLRLSLSATPNISYPALAEYLAQASISSPTAREVFDAVVAIRRSKLPDPAEEPNAGSFFKNPVISREQLAYTRLAYPGMPAYAQGDDHFKVPAAWLIERCGWKGQRRGGAGVHGAHALVLVNYGCVDGGELLQLAEAIRTSVAQRFGIWLEQEPRTYGAEL